MPKDFLTDPLWYKDAVIYELHVRSFFDSDDDGYGDFEGMRRRLPYLEQLGVNTLWLLPFLKSPLRDDGYDTSDYFGILPVHGTMEDFQAFLDEAHERGMRVITELVLNHTSDQHPWFQEARDPTSPRHHWYVWSDTTDKYAEARIIFTDTEISNWTWDQKAGKYYWHRFFSHQPDLNYDNPEVREAMKEALFFWLDMGVDGLRLDAVPYLYEREGTNCENLPETIQYIVELRQAIEERYGPGKVLLAEANQWPEDTLPYFADGKGVQMAFNFPVMPRMYMAVRRENRRPLVEMLELTKDIPEQAQWAIFLRNHDELTLEMVTDEERDYMYHEYAADARFRINVGIRRRLAPLLYGERRRIELMNALLLSLKGSPVLYYGDEIGMGDDPFLGDRNGVRTPMQWSPDKNGGFSRAEHHQLFLPMISRGPYSYEFVNVEDAERNSHSLLSFMKRLLALRKQHARVFGRGSMTMIPLENQAVLAFVREYEGDRILVLANMSRFTQSVMLPITEDLQGLTPVELFSQNPFPAFSDDEYHLLLAPHGFLWMALEPEEVIQKRKGAKESGLTSTVGRDLPVIRVPEGLENVLVKTLVQNQGMEKFEALLPAFLSDQRWFGSRGELIRKVRLADAVRLKAHPLPIYLSVLHVDVDGRRDTYALPLALTPEDEAQTIIDTTPHAAIAWIETPKSRGLLHDAAVHEDFWLKLFRWWQRGSRGRSLKGLYVAEMDRQLAGETVSSARVLSGEQSNSSAIIDDKFFVKLYRRLEVGLNPETEMLEYLTESGFQFVPALYGKLSFSRPRERYALGVVQEALSVEQDGWDYALDIIGRFLDRVTELSPPADELPTSFSDTIPTRLEEVAPEMVSLASVLGIRTAELHLALSKAEAGGLTPEEPSPDDLPRLVERVKNEIARTRKSIEDDYPKASPIDDELWDRGLRFLDDVAELGIPSSKIRIHGDLHLGQVILSDGEYYILDFEGEPARSLEERRRSDYGLRDVGGMLRSIEYAALSAWHRREEEDEELKEWVRYLVEWSEAIFLDGYFSASEEGPYAQPDHLREPLVWLYLLDKALYEVRYELNNRPSWAWLPLDGLQRILRRLERLAPETQTEE